MNNHHNSVTKLTGFNFYNIIPFAILVICGLTLASCSVFDDEEEEVYEWVGDWEPIQEEWDDLYFKLTEDVIYAASESEEGTDCHTGKYEIQEIDGNVVYAIHEEEDVEEERFDRKVIMEVRLEVTDDEVLEWTYLDYLINGESLEYLPDTITLTPIDQMPFDVNDCRVTVFY